MSRVLTNCKLFFFNYVFIYYCITTYLFQNRECVLLKLVKMEKLIFLLCLTCCQTSCLMYSKQFFFVPFGYSGKILFCSLRNLLNVNSLVLSSWLFWLDSKFGCRVHFTLSMPFVFIWKFKCLCFCHVW